MKRTLLSLVLGSAAIVGSLSVASDALAGWGRTRVYHAPAPAAVVTNHVVVPSASYYAPAPTTSYYPPAPTTSHYAPAPTTSYYAPAPTTSYYAPAPTTSYYAPAPTTSYYAPTARGRIVAPPGSIVLPHPSGYRW